MGVGTTALTLIRLWYEIPGKPGVDALILERCLSSSRTSFGQQIRCGAAAQQPTRQCAPSCFESRTLVLHN